jgi:hypothetical protein
MERSSANEVRALQQLALWKSRFEGLGLTACMGSKPRAATSATDLNIIGRES